MKKQTYVSDFLSKYTIRQLCEEEWEDADGLLPPRAHLRHKKQFKKAAKPIQERGAVQRRVN
ncbi:MAG: hypothetical protein AB7F40_06435 [Victivallaceae bacterium]|nr:hypothetical protein [Victivallaceae bacterium]